MIKEEIISEKIVKEFYEDFVNFLNVDVAVAGAGPSGLVAAYELARNGKKVAVFEEKLAVGGGMWGGGMTFPTILILKDVKPILDEVGAKTKDVGNGYWAANSIECVAKLCAAALDAGAKIFNALRVEDVVVRDKKVVGFVINWSSVKLANLHVDPLSIRANFCIDATGHRAEVCRIVEKKVGQLKTPTGKVEGEKSMFSEMGEKEVIKNTKEVFPGLFVTGMAANAVFGSPRMGAIFSGMLLSGKRVAELILKKLK